MTKKKRFLFSFLFWVIYCLILSAYGAYREVTNEGGYDLNSGLILFFEIMLVSLLCESVLMIGSLMLLFYYLDKHVQNTKLKLVLTFLGIIFIQLLTYPIAWTIFYDVKHLRFSSYFEIIGTHFKFVFMRFDKNLPWLIIPVLLSFLSTIIYNKNTQNA